MSSYGKNKALAAILLTIAIIIALGIIANALMPEPQSQETPASFVSDKVTITE